MTEILDPPRRAARRAARDERTPHPAAAAALADRRVVLPRPLRARTASTRPAAWSSRPHPHIGLQTVSWLFGGEIEHRDSAGSHALVRPGELNLMTAGRGITHSEVSTDEATVLHGVQLWVALPGGVPRRRAGLRPLRARRSCTATGWDAQVFLGSLLGSTSPVDDVHPAARRRAASSTAGTTLHARRRPVLRARRAGRLRHGPRQRRRGHAARARPTSPPGERARARRRRPRPRCCCSAARRSARRS